MADELPEARDQVCPTCNGVGAVPARVIQEVRAAQHAHRDLLVIREFIERELLAVSRRRPEKMREAVNTLYGAVIRLWQAMGGPDA